MMDFDAILNRVRERSPLVHCITNYVTANDCANILLACGASPIMADEPEEAEEITALSDGLVLNMGTLHRHTVPSMLAAGRRANALGHPVTLDPVGAGASRFRTETAARLLEEVRFSVIRANVSECRTLARGSAGTKGVDAGEADHTAGSEEVVALARELAKRTGAVAAVTGETDVVTDGERVCLIRNGHPLMSRVTGTGCMLSALTAACAAANRERIFEAVCAAVTAMGLCGELAHARLGPGGGSASLRAGLIDAVYHLSGQSLKEGAKYELR